MKSKTFFQDICVSQIVLGTDVYGTDLPRADAFSLLDAYMAQGGNTLDTARMYGKGVSEQTIGSWLKERKCRSKVILSSKCAHPPVSDMTCSRLSREEIESDVNESLQALGTDYIDILWLHRDDVQVPVSGIIDTLNGLVKQGKIRCFGGSNWTAARFAEANAYASATGQQGFSGSQLKWSVAASSPDYVDDPTLVEMDGVQYDYYSSTHMPVFAYASQAKGFFQKYAAGGMAALSQKASQRYYSEENVRVCSELQKLAAELSLPLSAVVIAALTSNTDFDTVCIVGCKNTEQLADTMTGADVSLPYARIRPLFNF